MGAMKGDQNCICVTDIGALTFVANVCVGSAGCPSTEKMVPVRIVCKPEAADMVMYGVACMLALRSCVGIKFVSLYDCTPLRFRCV